MAARTALASMRAPLAFALRRLLARPFSTCALIATLAAACCLIGWSSLAAALAQEETVHRQLASVPPAQRSIDVRYYTLPLESDFRADPVTAAFHEFADVTASLSRVQVWHSIDPNDPTGLRLVVAARPRADVALAAGRLPRPCGSHTCEAVALRGPAQLGQRVPLGQGRFALIVGRGELRPQALPDRSQLASETLLVGSLAPPLRPLVRQTGSTVVYTAPLDPAKVHGFELAGLRERLREQIVRLERGDPLVRATGPLATLAQLQERGAVAKRRLLLVAGQAAALIIAFAAFIATARRRENDLAASQLLTLGASRLQVRLARGLEAAGPGLAAVVLSLAGLLAAAAMLAGSRGLPLAFARTALPLTTVLAILGAGAASAVMLLFAAARPRRAWSGVGALELTAVVALAVLIWQAATTGALDPERVARGGGPLILVVPALGFFVAGVLMLRVVPLALRASERIARRGPIAARLAFLTAARSPWQTAAATTFLAVALGSALFSLDYRATLDRQGRDEARFASGAAWRVVEHGGHGVTPLTRFASISRERPTPAARLDGRVVEAYPAGAELPVTVLALPAARIRDVLGWRRGFSPLAPEDIARRLRPHRVDLAGPRLDGDALRVLARANTDYPRLIVLHLLLPGQGFAHVRLGVVWHRWSRLRISLPRRLRGAELVGVEFAPTYVPTDFKYDPKGFIDLGRIEQRHGGVWSLLPSLDRWTQTTSPDGTAGILVSTPLAGAPIARSLRFYLNGTFRPLIHPAVGLPLPDPGFQTGPIPVLASGPVAAQAVDRLLTLDLPGLQIEGRVVVGASLFPTITSGQSAFVVVDYRTLFAAMNADQPGLLEPGEAWFFDPQRPGFAAALGRSPFRLDRAVSEQALEARSRNDPLASGTRSVLTVTAALAAALALVGLVLAARSALAAERLQLAEYEALGVARSTLRRSAQLRLLVLSLLGVVAGILGGLLSARITGAFVAVSGTARRPLPPIVTVIAWPASAAIVGAVALAAAVSAALVTRRALREPAARRLRL